MSEPDKKPCPHLNTITSPQFDAMIREEKVVGYQLRVRINCADCGIPFLFVGLPAATGEMGHNPHVRFNNKEAVIALIAGQKTFEAN
jgi:hypothetical protein